MVSLNMILPTSGERKWYCLNAVFLLCLSALGCAPAVQMQIRESTNAKRKVSLTDASYVIRQGTLEFLARAPSKPSFLSLITFGGIKDADSPKYFVRLVVSRKDNEDVAMVSILRAPWEGGELLRGSGKALIKKTAEDRLDVECIVTVRTSIGFLKREATVLINGRFRRSDKRFGEILADYESEERRLVRVYDSRNR